jgi:protoporphyrinogen oxidase
MCAQVIDPAAARGADAHASGAPGIAVLGAGPAGLTAAHVLASRECRATVFEADSSVGGIAKTVERDGFRFDLGGHRFFTKVRPIERLWHTMLREDFLMRSRLSRIYYEGQFFSYPLVARDVVGRLGIVESFRCALSYVASRVNRHRRPDVTFEDWVTSRFGRRLYNSFFGPYTEKVWGIPGSQIQSAWAAQRIKNFSLFKALLTILRVRRQHVTTLIEEFRYPRLGPGQMWEAFAERARGAGIDVKLRHRCVGVEHDDGNITGIVIEHQDARTRHEVDGVISTLALQDLVLAMDPPAPAPVQAAARQLHYRDFVLVALMTTERDPFPDNWIYLHDPDTRAGRVQNFGAWSEAMVRPGHSCLGVEYFCFQGDELWEMPETQMVELAREELGRIGLIDPAKVVGGVKVRVPKAYPVYDPGYVEATATIRTYLEQFSNLQTCGRNGLHRYNNQDHSMWTAVLAAVNLVDGASHDVWSVNVDADYLEEGDVVDDVLNVELVE